VHTSAANRNLSLRDDRREAKRSPGAAKVFPVRRWHPPLCAQCRIPMTLTQIERPLFRVRTDKFICVECGLVDKIARGKQPTQQGPQ
jgi:hypothetical protein